MKPYYELFADRILYFCNKRGITPNHLASISGVPQSTINNILCGISKNPRMQTLHKIALAFSMTPSEFLDFEELNNHSFEEDETDE